MSGDKAFQHRVIRSGVFCGPAESKLQALLDQGAIVTSVRAEFVLPNRQKGSIDTEGNCTWDKASIHVAHVSEELVKQLQQAPIGLNSSPDVLEAMQAVFCRELDQLSMVQHGEAVSPHLVFVADQVRRTLSCSPHPEAPAWVKFLLDRILQAGHAGHCLHNNMVSTGDPKHAWKCADCGYIYGKT